MLKLPNNAVKTVLIKKDEMVNVGKFGSFASSQLVGQLFGMTFELLPDGKTLKVKDDLPLTEVGQFDQSVPLSHC